METDGSIDSRKKEVEPSYRRLSIPSRYDVTGYFAITQKRTSSTTCRQPTLQSLVHDPAPCLMACVVIRDQYLHDVCRILT
jgi:hypothetical protein